MMTRQEEFNHAIIALSDPVGIAVEPILSDYIRSGLTNYFMYGCEAGGFLTAVLSGDLFAASLKADHINGPLLFKIANWVHFNAPRGSWGSTSIIKHWMASNSIRIDLKDQFEKEEIWRKLNKET